MDVLPASWAAWIAWAFTFTNSLRLLFYLPQMRAIVRSTDRARDIALTTWWMWTLNNVLGALYASVVARDPLLALSFVGSALACGATIALTLRQRRHRPCIDTPIATDPPVRLPAVPPRTRGPRLPRPTLTSSGTEL